jgi:hypothetical protein
MRVLQHSTEWQLSPARLIGALNSAIVNDLGKGYSRVQANEDMQYINSVLNIDWKEANVRTEKIAMYSKGWCTTFFKNRKTSKNS